MTWNDLPHDAQKLQLFIVFPLRINFKYQRYHYPFSPVGTGTQYFYMWYPEYNQAKRVLLNLLCGARFVANVSAICHEKSIDFRVCYWTVEHLITIHLPLGLHFGTFCVEWSWITFPVLKRDISSPGLSLYSRTCAEMGISSYSSFRATWCYP